MNEKEFTLTREQRLFIRDYVKSIINNNAAIFAGAGLSIPSGTMSWSELLKDVAKELELTDDRTTDMATLAQYYVNYKDSRSEISQMIMESFNDFIQPNINQSLVAQLDIDTVWTTNYDDLLEKAYMKEHKNVVVKRSPDDFSLNNLRKDVVIYKMHGDITQPTNAIITKNDYELYNDTHSVYTTALKGDLVGKKFLFIGFSFDDPNLDYILARVKALVGQNKPNHYFFIKKIKKGKDESEAAFKLRCTKQNLKIIDLKRYGINSVLLDDYNDITQILQIINKLSKCNNIFISGAISGQENISDDLVNKLIEQITIKLINKKNRIISGFGLGVGSVLVNTVLGIVSQNPWLKLDDSLRIFPFPQGNGSNLTNYREKIIKDAGIVIFLFGTKIEDGKSVISTGMMEEFEIAHATGVRVIPIGCTGGASRDIYDIVAGDSEKYYEGKQEVFNLLTQAKDHSLSNELDVANLSSLVVSIVEEIQKIE